jgi:hypothetical protein
VAVAQAGLPERCVQLANVRSAAEPAAVELVHSDWALADCSAGLPSDDSAWAVVPAVLWAVGSVPAGLVALMVHGSTPADCSEQADRSEQHCSLDV